MPSAASNLARKRTFSVFSTAARASEMWKNPSSVVYRKCGVLVCNTLRGAVQLQWCSVSVTEGHDRGGTYVGVGGEL